VSVSYFVRYRPLAWQAMNRAFASPERAAAREDFKRVMTFEGTVTHQAMVSEEVWRKTP
jgi:hypothetical protein